MSKSSEEARKWMGLPEEEDQRQWMEAMDELYWAIEHEQPQEDR
jgi:hypothetical protein